MANRDSAFGVLNLSTGGVDVQAKRRLNRAVQPVLEMLETRQLLSALPPIIVEAENFDAGGEGVAYHDLDSRNYGGAYRTTEGVDVEKSSDIGGGYDIGRMARGEWLQYTIDVPATGTYKLENRFYSDSNGGSFHIDVDGVNRTGSMAVPARRSGWRNLESPEMQLTAGKHVMRFYVDSTGDRQYMGWLNRITVTNVAPAAPTALSATATSSSGISLTWSDNATNETGYRVERMSGTGSYQPIATLGANATSYSDSGLTASTAYTYRVVAIQNTITSDYSNASSATTPAASNPTPTPTPTQNWTSTSFATQTGQFTADVDVTPTAGNLDLVVGLSNGPAAAWSDLAVTARFNTDGTIDAREGFSYRADSVVSYAAGSKYHVKFVVDVANGTYDMYVTAGGTTTKVAANYAFRAEQAGVTQLNSLSSYESTGTGSAAVTGLVVAPVAPTATAPAAPSGLTATATSASDITLNWVDNATNETAYQLERRTGTSGTWQSIASLAANSRSYADQGLAAGTQYFYRVRAANGQLFSAYSAEANATTTASAPSYTPTWKNTAFASQTGQFTAEFDATPMTTGMDVVVGTSDGTAAAWSDLAAAVRFNGNGTIDARNGGGYEASADVGYTPGTKYHFKMVVNLSNKSYDVFVTNGTATTQIAAGFAFRSEQAAVAQLNNLASYNSAGDATLSGLIIAAAAPTAPAAPGNLTAAAASSSAITLNWSDNSNNETGFQIDRKTGAAGTWQTVSTLGGNISSYTNTGLAASTQYFYRVRALNGQLVSAYSAEATATTLASTPTVPATGVTMTPGSGFSAATAQPGRAGSSSQFGYNDRVIARWDTVPYQTVTDKLNVGVVAFHNSGIDRVAFSVNGGAWVDVREMTLNPQTGVVEYWATLDASQFSKDGNVEVRAIAYPKVGIARVLQGADVSSNGSNPMFLNVNKNGTLPSLVRYVATTGSDSTGDGSDAKPFATIARAAQDIGTDSGTGTADGGTIYLKSGNYQLASVGVATNNRWLTIAAAPGVARGAVQITSAATAAGLNTKLVRFLNLTVHGSSTSKVLTNTIGLNGSLWVDHSDVIGPGQTTAQGTYGWYAQYLTDSNISQMRDGIAGDITRNVKMFNIGSDAFSGSYLVVNSSVVDLDRLSTSFHPDVYQVYPSANNVILYGVDATTNVEAQGIFVGAGCTLTDAAFVNVRIDNQDTPTPFNVFQFLGTLTNMYVKDSYFNGPSNWRTDAGMVATDVVVEGTVFTDDPGAAPGVLYR